MNEETEIETLKWNILRSIHEMERIYNKRMENPDKYDEKLTKDIQRAISNMIKRLEMIKQGKD